MVQNTAKKYTVEGYIYSGNVTVQSGATSAITIQVASNFDFFAEKLSYTVSTATASIVPSFDVQIMRDQNNVFQAYIPNMSLAGMGINTAASPWVLYPVGQANWFSLSKPYKFNASSNMLISVKNTCSAAINVTFLVSGYKHVFSV
jgi:hypothetical protein